MDQGLARMVDLVAQPADLVVKGWKSLTWRWPRYQNIFTQVQLRAAT